MVQQTSLPGRAYTKTVIAEFCEQWRAIWLEAIRLRDHNPAVRRIAEAAPDQPDEAIRVLVPNLMVLHPRVAASVVALLDLVIDESRQDEDDPVSPVRHDPERVFVAVEGGRMMGTGGQQQHDRLAQLEAENAELRRQLEQALRVHERDREHMRSARTLLALRLDEPD